LAQILPQWTNRIPTIAAVSAPIAGALAALFIWYFFSPEYTDVGYRPVQPIEYSHKVHAGDLGIDCRYCHTGVETQAHANVPPTRTCMNCHTMVKADSEKIAPVQASFISGAPIEWIRVHNLPDYAYFDHSAHINVGVGCQSCHGNVHQMEVVRMAEPLSMSWCLDCHRNPDEHLRPLSEVTNMDWQRPHNHPQWLAEWLGQRDINPPIECSACHR
jgi:hypothetical protein